MSTGIEWTDETWNPVLGCTHVSAGCDNCYAAREASGRLKNHPLYEGLAVDGKFTGKVRLVQERLEQPLRWKRPRRIFVNSMSDLFHDDVPPSFIAQVFGAMATAHHHQFQVLTKRPGRMASLLRSRAFEQAVSDELADRLGMGGLAALADMERFPTWPLANVWLGTSVEDQKWADVRIPLLLKTPAAVRFLSCEPLLGPVSFRWPPWQPARDDGSLGNHLDGLRRLDWIIAGGESGPGARPMHLDWARTLRDQCVEAEVPFLFKQWGEWGVHTAYDDGRMSHVGKKRAGRELDGRTWDEYPAELVSA